MVVPVKLVSLLSLSHKQIIPISGYLYILFLPLRMLVLSHFQNSPLSQGTLVMLLPISLRDLNTWYYIFSEYSACIFCYWLLFHYLYQFNALVFYLLCVSRIMIHHIQHLYPGGIKKQPDIHPMNKF